MDITVSQNIAELALNKPEAYNAFDLELISEFARQLIRLSNDNSVKGIVVTGRGKAFCVGGGLSLETTLEKERDGLGRCGNHPDGIEGIQAFLKKRKPNFG